MREKIFTVIVIIVSLFIADAIITAMGDEMGDVTVIVLVIMVVYGRLSDEINKNREGTR